MERPSLPKGTRDFGPDVMAKRHYILNAIRRVYEKYGFLPLETPAMENLTTLTGKYGDEGDQLLFRILNSGDVIGELMQDKPGTSSEQLGRITKKGLRYDLTVPFARFVVMNRSELAFPFKRYQMQPVWRADRPQKGRYQEFHQCDADVVGTHSLICEAEIISMILEIFTSLGITDYRIKFNHRKILAGIAGILDASHQENQLFVAIDKLDKKSHADVAEELLRAGFQQPQIEKLFALLTPRDAVEETLDFLDGALATSVVGTTGISEIRQVLSFLEDYGSLSKHLHLDVSLARGLSYYTGCIFEVKINGVAIGSVSGGGRYDHLTASFGDKENLSGVGISFGVDRIYDAMQELQLFPDTVLYQTQIIICHFDESTRHYGLGMLRRLRDEGITAEIYPDLAKLKKQLDYANKKNIRFAMIVGEDEMKSQSFQCKDLQTGTQDSLTLDEIIRKMRTDHA